MEIVNGQNLLTIKWDTGNIYSYADVPEEVSVLVQTKEDFFRLVAPKLKTERGTKDNCPCGLVHRYIGE